MSGEKQNKASESSCEEATTNESKQLINKMNCELTLSLKEKLKDIPEAMEYIEKLHRIIKKQVKKIYKWKTRIKKMQTPMDAYTQTEDVNTFNNEDINSGNTDTKTKVVKTLADDIKEAAETALHNSGFVYEETSGLYYDYTTGYYYNAEYGLYYDGVTGTYLKYNQETQSYEFHSQVQVTPSNEKEKDGRTLGKRKVKTRHRAKVKTSSDMGDLMHSFNQMHINKLRNLALDVSKQWPPCVRIIVESSDVSKIKVGSLHIVTCDGGSLGREGDHSIIIPDINTSKHHLKFTFDKGSGHYFITDVGSRNGTLLNNKRMSPSKQESEPMKIIHGSKIQIGSTVLMCHIHEGNHTCGHCEPGLIQSSQEDAEIKKIQKKSRAEKYKSELKMLRKKCGIVSYDADLKLGSGYTDRAQQRRDTIGSQNPHEKTQVASLNESISAQNKGFKLLAKMGWKEGQSLGKDGTGMLEPVPLTSNKGTTGIGCSEEIVEIARPTEKQNIWQKTQDRFQKLPETNETFEESSD